MKQVLVFTKLWQALMLESSGISKEWVSQITSWKVQWDFLIDDRYVFSDLQSLSNSYSNILMAVKRLKNHSSGHEQKVWQPQDVNKEMIDIPLSLRSSFTSFKLITSESDCFGLWTDSIYYYATVCTLTTGKIVWVFKSIKLLKDGD